MRDVSLVVGQRTMIYGFRTASTMVAMYVKKDSGQMNCRIETVRINWGNLYGFSWFYSQILRQL